MYVLRMENETSGTSRVSFSPFWLVNVSLFSFSFSSGLFGAGVVGGGLVFVVSPFLGLASAFWGRFWRGFLEGGGVGGRS